LRAKRASELADRQARDKERREAELRVNLGDISKLTIFQ